MESFGILIFERIAEVNGAVVFVLMLDRVDVKNDHR